MQIGARGPRGKAMKRSTVGSPEAEYRFGGVAEASFLTPLGRASFLVTNIAFSLEACDCDCQVTYGIKREALVEISESLVRHAFDVFLCLLLHTVYLCDVFVDSNVDC